MITIPKPLQNAAFRFIKVQKGDKGAVETGWQRDKNYRFDSPALLNWINQGGNYGIIAGRGFLIIIDCDVPEIQKRLQALPDTFKVISPGHNGTHAYFYCPEWLENIKFQAPEDEDYGQIQAYNKYVLCPGSIHPNGKKYEIESNIPITRIVASQIKEAFSGFLEEPKPESIEIDTNGHPLMTFDKVLNFSLLKKRHGLSGIYYGAHPIHGSDTGQNFHVDTNKHVWHCFRHGTGGGAILWLAVQEGLIECKNARKGALRGEIFKKTVKIAQKKYGIDIKLATFEQEMLETLTKGEKRLVIKKMTVKNLLKVLGLTIKHDNINKIITFLSMLCVYTNESQFNISFRAPSSTGKSYIPIELAQLFPRADVMEIAYSSPSSFWHDTGKWDDKAKRIIIDLERKILIFLDQPHDMLLQRLRPLLSHDKRELLYKITDKREKKGLRTKNVIIRGFPSVIFCTGRIKMDEQEITRSILLSPETTEEKIRKGIYLKALRRGDKIAFNKWLNSKRERIILKHRIRKIKEENINSVIVDYKKVYKKFVKKYQKAVPRHMRDVARIISIIQGLALLNLWHRKKDKNNNVFASGVDVREAFKIYENVAKSQELGIPPYILRLYEEVVKPAFLEWNGGGQTCIGMPRKQILTKHQKVYGRPMAGWFLRQQIIPMLESSGLITEEIDPTDKRRKIIFIQGYREKYSESNSRGVNDFL